MENCTIIVREAQKSDAEFVATAVFMALGGDPKARALYPIFRELAGRELSQYSYRNALVATVDGEPAGAIVAYDGARLQELRVPLIALIKEQLGESLEIEEETAAGEFYIDSLAVAPSFRGKGVGLRLLAAMRDKAFDSGYENVGLLVDFDNPRAEKLYSSAGFKRVEETTFLGHRMWHMQAKKGDVCL